MKLFKEFLVYSIHSYVSCLLKPSVLDVNLVNVICSPILLEF